MDLDVIEYVMLRCLFKFLTSLRVCVKVMQNLCKRVENGIKASRNEWHIILRILNDCIVP